MDTRTEAVTDAGRNGHGKQTERSKDHMTDPIEGNDATGRDASLGVAPDEERNGAASTPYRP